MITWRMQNKELNIAFCIWRTDDKILHRETEIDYELQL